MSIITPVSAYKPLASHRFMKSMASGGLARFIMLEAFVEAGRTYQAYRRGGFDEGRERITEEFTAAVFWLGGVKAFNAINDKIGKWILGLKTANFDLGEDKARNPLKNFLHSEISTKTGKQFTESQIAKFKSAKLITSILLANAMIGFVVPKLNQRITRYYHRNDNAKPQTVQQNQEQMTQQTQQLPQTQQSSLAYNSVPVNMDKFIADAKTRSKDVSFGASPLLSLAFNLENNTTWQLLSTDIGTTSGRTISARNNDERREILFRDLSSIYFYMFNMPNINNWLNRIEQKGRKTRVDSMNAAYTKDLMVNLVNQNYNGKISAKDLAKEMLGDTSKTLPDTIKAKFKDGYMNIEDFKKEIPSFVPADSVEKFTKLAEDMSALQPKVAGTARITAEQAERMLQGGYLNNPEFLKNLYELAFGRTKKAGANFLNPYKFISYESVKAVDDDLKYFVQQIISKAEKAGKEITPEILEKASKMNFRMNVLNWGSGFAISALFLSTLIPKIQYWITKKVTGSDAFPGTEEYRKQQAAQNKAA